MGAEAEAEAHPLASLACTRLDPAETYHFFNDDIVFCTNEIRTPESLGGPDKRHWITSSCSSELMYDQLFEFFSEVYSSVDAQRINEEPVRRKICSAIAAFANRFHSSLGYRFHKQIEFLRVCRTRALEEEKCRIKAKQASGEDVESTQSDEDTWLSVSRGRTPTSAKLAPLLPREWPHLPHRDPIEWKANDDAVVKFLTRLVALPALSLKYEPICLSSFVNAVFEYLLWAGLDVSFLVQHNANDAFMPLAKTLNQKSLAGVLTLLGMAIQLQSASLVALVAFLLAYFGESIPIKEFLELKLLQITQASLCQFVQFGREAQRDLPHPRSLVSHWRICSYQPSTSDAIATDGRFLYIFGRVGLLKVGTGHENTVRDYVYQHNKNYCRSRDAERSWLCCIGSFLYCRTIVTPGHCVDRIRCSDLNGIEELLIAPRAGLFGGGITGSSVYAMISDGKSLYTVKCIDTTKSSKRSSKRSKKNRLMKTRKTIRRQRTLPVRSLDDLANLAETPASENQGCSIRVGDRVVRGPDWKWSNQDGGDGCLGTVERLSAWGDDKGYGVTVRWDKAQRMNTYRWGAEGCYDLVIVRVKNGRIIERLKHPEQKTEPPKTEEIPEIPRHQFVVYEHDVTNLTSVSQLEDEDVGELFDLIPAQRGKGNDHEMGIVCALHSHALFLCETPTIWMCDGALVGCVGEEQGRRFRCRSGCDYDLCESCLLSTMTGSSLSPKCTQSRDDVSDEVMSPRRKPTEKKGDVQTTEDGKKRGDFADEEQEIASYLKQEILFPSVDDSFFTEEIDSAPQPTEENKRDNEALIQELAAFWNGHFSDKECSIALRKNNFNIEDACCWLHQCGAKLRQQMIIPTSKAVLLNSPRRSGSLDPVLLIAGSFYTTNAQLCVVAPPGLYAMGDELSQQTKRTSSFSDSAWVFSIQTGDLVLPAQSPTVIKNLSAGSPICYDRGRNRILVFSSYLNELEEYENTKHVPHCSLEEDHQSVNEFAFESASDLGVFLFHQLERITGNRSSIAVFKHPREALEEYMVQLESDIIRDAENPVNSNNQLPYKVKSRKLRNLRSRLLEMERLGVRDPPGFFSPYSLDFSKAGFHFLLSSIVELRKNKSRDNLMLTSFLLLRLCVMLEEFDRMAVTVLHERFPSELLMEAQELLWGLASGEEMLIQAKQSCGSVEERVVLSAQMAVLHGINVHLFYVTPDARVSILVKLVERIRGGSPRLLSDQYFRLMSRNEPPMNDRHECEVSMLCRLLMQSKHGDKSSFFCRLPASDQLFTALVEALVELAWLEYQTWLSDPVLFTWSFPLTSPVHQALHSLLNCVSAHLYDPCRSNQSSDQGIKLDFDIFARTCIPACVRILKSTATCSTLHHSDDMLRCSVVGSILPLLLATIGNFPTSISPELRNCLIELLGVVKDAAEKRLDSLDELKRIGVFCGELMVESAHPYSRSQAAFRRTIRIPGASFLHFEFDSRCRTVDEADIVSISPGNAMLHADRISYGDNGIGNAGGCFFGSYLHGSWPTEGLTIVGDTATVMLCSANHSRDDDDAPESSRWGIRCLVRGLKTHRLPWLVELSLLNAYTCSLIGEALVYNDLENKCEATNRLWTDEKLLALARSRRFILADEVATTAIVDRIFKLFRPRQFSAEADQKPWNEALRCAAKCLVVHSGMLHTPQQENSTLFASVVNNIRRIEHWMMRRIQLEKEWNYLLDEGIDLVEFKERYQTNPERLREFCELKDVVFDKKDLDDSALHLFQAMTTESISDPRHRRVYNEIHTKVIEMVVDKVMFLLDTTEEPATPVDNDELPDSGMNLVAEFVQSNVKLADIKKCVSFQTQRASDCVNGLQLFEECQRTLRCGKLQSFFVARLLAQLSQDDRRCSRLGLCGGCQLVPTLCNQIEDMIDSIIDHSFAITTTNNHDGLMLRVLALADACFLKTKRSFTVDFIYELLQMAIELLNSCSKLELGKQNADVCQGVHNIVWVLFRYLLGVLPNAKATGSRTVLEQLFKKVEIMLDSFVECYLTSSAEQPANHGVEEGLQRLLSCLIQNGRLFTEFGDLDRWIDTCVSLLEKSYNAGVCSAAVKLLTVILRNRFRNPHDDAKFELKIRDGLVEQLLHCAGNLICLRPSTTSAVKSVEPDQKFCVVIFQTEEMATSINDAIQKVGEPDLAFLGIPLEVLQHEKDRDQPSESVSNNLSMIHRGVRCDGCNQNPLRGMRFKCFSCSNYDLCLKCYVGKKHDENHQFVRLCDSSGMGDLLPPRSKSDSILPETAVVGSAEWKVAVLRVELACKGYAVFRVDRLQESVACAKQLAAVGLVVSVLPQNELDEINSLNDWESQIHLALEPGSLRFSKRSCASQSSFNTWKPNDMDVIKPLNLVARSANRKDTPVQPSMEICEHIASDVHNLVRTLLSGSSEMRLSSMKVLVRSVELIPSVYDVGFNLETSNWYAQSLGAINVIGGFEEPLRVGGSVLVRERPGSTMERRGKVSLFDSGNNQVLVQLHSENDVSQMEVDASDVVPVQEVELDPSTTRELECLAPTLISILLKLHHFICEVDVKECFDLSIVRADMAARVLRCFVNFLPDWPSILDNRIISTYGNAATLLLDLAKKTQSNVHMDNLRQKCHASRALCWLSYRSTWVSTRPISKLSLSDGTSAQATIEPAPSTLSSAMTDGDDKTTNAELSYLMYAYSGLDNDLPQHAGRNKLLEYWEKNVIPAIQSYVRGSFKSYEMDYFFAQLREPLRQGNSAAAMKIAFTLCDGHVPSGCNYPDPNTDWSALQLDDIEIGESYLICCDALAAISWPTEMCWTNRHTGVARSIHASGCVLLQLVNPTSSRVERWWYRLEHLKIPFSKQANGCSDNDSIIIRSRTLVYNKQLVCCIARHGVFQLLKVSSDFLTWEHPAITKAGVRYELETLLRLAAAEDLACPDKFHLVEGVVDKNDCSRIAASGESTPLMRTLSRVLRERLDVLYRETHHQRKKESPKLTPDERRSQTKPAKAGSCKRQVKLVSTAKTTAKTTESESKITAGANMLIESLLHQHKQCVDSVLSFLQQRSFVVVSESPPKPVVLIRSRGASCMVITFFVHPVLMDLQAGCSLEFFTDRRCRNRIRGYFCEKSSLNCLAPLVVPGDECYVKISQGQYARYKFRVDPFTSDYGLALWIADELYHRLSSSSCSALTSAEYHSALSNLFRSLADLVTTQGPVPLPLVAKIPVLVQTAKLINLTLAKGIETSVPIAKLAVLSRELSVIYENEKSTQNAQYSVYTQQLAEVVSLVEEVSHIKGGSSMILDGEWWKSFVRMVIFTRSLHHQPRETSQTGDGYKRLQCGRAPTAEVERAHSLLAESDLFCDRLLIIQQLPRTNRIAELEQALTRFLRRLCLEECGEADDQNVSSASEVIRHGIFSNVLYLAVDESGFSKGYAVVDVGRVDILANLLRRMSGEKLVFEGPTTNENEEMVALIEKHVKNSDVGKEQVDKSSQDVTESNWTCSVCTLENDLSEDTCEACGSPIPPNFTALQRAASNDTEHSTTLSGPESSRGWTCSTCTLLNSWSEIECGVCGSERSVVMIPPSGPHDVPTETEKGEDESSAYASDATEHERHRLSGVKFSHALLASKESGTCFAEIAEFLLTRFVDKDGKLVEPLRKLILKGLDNGEGDLNAHAVASTFGFLTLIDDLVTDKERAIHQVMMKATRLATESPRDMYEFLRRLGYDLQFASSHYSSKEIAFQSQAKWSLAMDLQLISLCKERCSMLGVLTLRELCPSHLISTRCSKEYPLLTSLEVRDLRLRLLVLQTLNQLVDETLPLVNLRSWNEGNSLRNRLAGIRQLLFTGVKIRFFTLVEDNTSNLGVSFASSDGNLKKPLVTIDRRKILSYRQQREQGAASSFSLLDPNASVFAATREQLLKVKARELLAKRPLGASDPFVAFIVIFAGENVVGEGGPYRQLFNDISSELVTAEDSLFIPTPNNWMRVGEFRERLIPKPSNLSKEALRLYEFVGVLMGCCLRTGVRLNVRLAPIVWKMFVKQSLTFADLEYVDWSLCESLKNLELMTESLDLGDSEVLYESFTATLSDGKTVELKPDGINTPITKSNCKEYIRAVKSLRLQECRPQVDAMLRGISRIVPIQLLQLCTWSELQQWICGRFDVDVALLKRHTRYAAGMTPEKCPQLDMFWNVLTSLSEENRRRFINFAWGQETLPADDAEFDRTHTRLLIKPPSVETANQDAQLPKADTCFFNIELPAYSSEEIMREKLLLAITMCTSMDGDEQAGRLDIYYANDEEDEPLG